MSVKPQFPVLLSVEITETDSAFEIEADVSGFHAHNVSVTTWEDSLIVEMISQHEPGQSYYLGEMEAESYRRIIPLGFEIGAQAIKSTYKNGMLDINVPKIDSAKASTLRLAASSN